MWLTFRSLSTLARAMSSSPPTPPPDRCVKAGRAAIAPRAGRSPKRRSATISRPEPDDRAARDGPDPWRRPRLQSRTAPASWARSRLLSFDSTDRPRGPVTAQGIAACDADARPGHTVRNFTRARFRGVVLVVTLTRGAGAGLAASRPRCRRAPGSVAGRLSPCVPMGPAERCRPAAGSGSPPAAACGTDGRRGRRLWGSFNDVAR